MLKTIPAGRIGTTGDTAATGAFLVSDEAGYVSGTNIVMSGRLGL